VDEAQLVEVRQRAGHLRHPLGGHLRGWDESERRICAVWNCPRDDAADPFRPVPRDRGRIRRLPPHTDFLLHIFVQISLSDLLL